MFINALVLTAGGNPAIDSRMIGFRRGTGLIWEGVGGLSVNNNPMFNRFVIELGHRVTDIPDPFKELKLDGIAVIKKDTAPTKAYDGDYQHAGINAYVETSVKAGGRTQYIHVVGDPGQHSFEELYAWMVDLMNGKHNDKCLNAIVLAPLAAPRSNDGTPHYN
jgi:hypothetical protein